MVLQNNKDFVDCNDDENAQKNKGSVDFNGDKNATKRTDKS